MEVGDQIIDHPEAKPWIDVKIAPSGHGLQPPGGLPRTFERPHGGGAHRPDFPPSLFRHLDRVDRCLGNAEIFLVNPVAGNILVAHRGKGPIADVQGHLAEEDAFFPMLSSNWSVKCSPAVGAATAPGWLA